MTNKWNQYGGWGDISLSILYNDINYFFNFEAEGGTRKRKVFDQLSWETLYWNTKRNMISII